jgi:hypothetical protein
MTTTMNGYRIRVAIAAALVAFGFTKLLAQLFLGNWQVLSAGQSDIAARGIWLLAAILPEIAVGSVALGLAVVVTLTRRTGESLPTRLVVACLGAVVGAALVVLGADPTVLALRLLPWSSSVTYHAVSMIVALVVLCVGIAGTVRLARASRFTSAAA